MALPPQDQGDSVIFGAWKGIKNTVTQERLAPDELELAINVDIDDAGQIHRRRGKTLRAAGNFHSLFESTRGVYGVKNGVLGKINPDFSFVEIQDGMTQDPIAYVEVGDTIYFSSASNSGKIKADNSYAPWGTLTPENTWLSPVVNPTSTLEKVGGKLIGPPPMATSLAYFNGRIYMAQGKTLWATELYLYDYVDKTRNFLPFEHEITDVANVTDGLYVGTSDSLWFLSGPFTQMARQMLSDYGVLPRSMISVPSELIQPQVARDGPTKNAILCMTTWGIIAGFDGGWSQNITQDTVLFPDAISTAALFRRQDGVNQYIAVQDSGGTPTSTARIGDYVDAEIRRFQGV